MASHKPLMNSIGEVGELTAEDAANVAEGLPAPPSE